MATDKFSNLIRTSGALILAATAALMLSGCVGVAYMVKANESVTAGKVYRLKVYDKFGMVDKAGYEREDSGLLNFKGNKTWFKVYGGEATAEQVVPYRYVIIGTDGTWEGTTIFNNGPIGTGGAFVNEGVPLLKAGDLVDVYVPEEPWVLKDRRHNTVIRLVCMAEDKACAKREKGDHRRADGWVVQPKGQFDERLLNVTAHMDLTGHWLPGNEPKRLSLPAGVVAETPKVSAWGE